MKITVSSKLTDEQMEALRRANPKEPILLVSNMNEMYVEVEYED